MKLTTRGAQSSSRGNIENMGHEAHLWRINWRKLGYKFCGIYAISPDNGWPTKIGISQNPVKRLINLQGACWKRLDIARYCYAEDFTAARAVEKKVHETLKSDGLLLHGEWFDIRPEKALEIIEFCALSLGVVVRKDVPDQTTWEAMNRFLAEKADDDHFAKYGYRE